MNVRIAVSIAAFIAAISCGVLSALVTFMMIGEINRKVPTNERISYWLMYPTKGSHIYREYRRQYPDGWLRRVAIALWILGPVFLLLSLWFSGFFPAFFGPLLSR